MLCIKYNTQRKKRPENGADKDERTDGVVTNELLVYRTTG